MRFQRWLPTTTSVALFSRVKSSMHHATFMPCGAEDHGSGVKI
jgi:hypothetical protein